MVWPNWCREISSGLWDVATGVCKNDFYALVGRLRGTGRSFDGRLPDYYEYVQRAATDFGSLPDARSSKGNLLRLICENVCDHYATSTRSNMGRSNTGSPGPTIEKDHGDKGVSSGWDPKNPKRRFDLLCPGEAIDTVIGHCHTVPPTRESLEQYIESLADTDEYYPSDNNLNLDLFENPINYDEFLMYGTDSEDSN